VAHRCIAWLKSIRHGAADSLALLHNSGVAMLNNAAS